MTFYNVIFYYITKRLYIIILNQRVGCICSFEKKTSVIYIIVLLFFIFVYYWIRLVFGDNLFWVLLLRYSIYQRVWKQNESTEYVH